MRHLYRCLLLSIPLLTILFPNSLSAKDSDKSLFKHIKYADAWHSSRKTGRPMLLYVTTVNCHFCRKMERESYSKQHILSTIQQDYEAVAIKNSVSPDLVRKLGVRVFPTTIIVAPTGKIVDRIEGFLGPEKLASHLTSTTRTAQVLPKESDPGDQKERQ